MRISLIQCLSVGKEGIIGLKWIMMQALLNPIVVAEPVQHRPDPVMLQISLNVFLEILLLSEEEVPYCRVSLREECIIIPFGDFLNHALQAMIGKKGRYY
jgi:hypothetical protein